MFSYLTFHYILECLQEHRTMIKTCIKHETVLELCKAHHKGILFAKGGCIIDSYYIMF